ncbi:MAG: CobD/CbiB family protein [Casimicrobiaceae bacterium]
MTLLAILAALGLEQWRAFEWRAAAERGFVTLARALERQLNGGTAGQGVVAAALALLPLSLFAAAVWWLADAVHPLLGLVWNALVLYLLMGFRRFSHAVSAIIQAFNEGDLTAARRALGGWRGGFPGELGSDEIARLAVERGLTDAYRQVFAVLFWFVVLPGPAGAVLYRATTLLASEWRGNAPGDDATPFSRSRAEFGKPARSLQDVLDWIPARLTALGFAIVGDFEDAAYCWRMQAKTWPLSEGGEPAGIILASGAGALGVQLGGPIPLPGGELLPRPELGMGEPATPEVLPSAVGLAWRALVLWLLIVLLITLANWAP